MLAWCISLDVASASNKVFVRRRTVRAGTAHSQGRSRTLASTRLHVDLHARTLSVHTIKGYKQPNGVVMVFLPLCFPHFGTSLAIGMCVSSRLPLEDSMIRGVILSVALHMTFATHTCVWGQATPVAPQKKSTSTNSADEQVVRQSVVKFVELYNAHKPDDLAALFANDARMVFRDGSEVNGRSEIAASFDSAFSVDPKCAISVVVDSIRFLTADVAVEEGYTTDFPDGETQTARSRYTVLHLKKTDGWRMQSVRVEEEESLSALRDLQPLAWLVGDWIDEGRAENVESTIRWDENKSFLIEEFKVVREGSVVLKGTQRIGWDPQAKQIRSWIFDSAGGFAEATWAGVDDAWVVKVKGVQADGTSSSATRKLQRVAKNRLTWTSQDRIVGAEALPDFTVTLVPKAPAAE